MPLLQTVFTLKRLWYFLKEVWMALSYSMEAKERSSHITKSMRVVAVKQETRVSKLFIDLTCKALFLFKQFFISSHYRNA